MDEINAEKNATDQDTHSDDAKQTSHEHAYNHGHHIDIADGKVIIDGGKVLIIDDNGIKVNGGKAVNIDSDGININNGTFTVTNDGIRMGNLVIDNRGIHTDGGKTVAGSFAEKSSNHITTSSIPMPMTTHFQTSISNLMNKNRSILKSTWTV